MKSPLLLGLLIHLVIVLFSIWQAKKNGDTFAFSLVKSVAILYAFSGAILAYYAFVNVNPAWGSRQLSEYTFAQSALAIPRFLISFFIG